MIENFIKYINIYITTEKVRLFFIHEKRFFMQQKKVCFYKAVFAVSKVMRVFCI